MATTKKDLSRIEWRLMNICWDRGEVSARDVYEETAKTRPRSYQTIKTMMDRLVTKGYLARRKFGPIWLYTTSVQRTAVVGREIDTFVTTVLDKTFTPLLMHFVGREKLSAEELAALKNLIEAHKDDADAPGGTA